jgi:hypothetical protein
MTNFKAWKLSVDRHLVQLVGMTSDDMPDAAWYDYYECELHPLDAIANAADEMWDDMPGIEFLHEEIDTLLMKKKGQVIHG